ncbi:MAG: domain S-box-containing protein [Hyphomicrobiales bacterium]|nr:domain S-box-containing protein [Hyphomicrobiales bacterium]
MSAPRARTLYIDDDPGLCLLVQKNLARQGYVVEIATDGASGVARIAQGGIDVVALDHYMPNQDGLETLASIRSLAEPPPVIYVTAMQEGRVAVAALKAGAADYVAKDVQGEFLVLLQRAIDAAFDAVRLRHAKDAAEAESKRHWQLTQFIVDTIRDPLVVLESDMTIVTASHAFLTMFGITEAEARGKRVSELGQRQWDVPALRHLMEQVLPKNKPIESFEIEDEFPGLGRRVFNLNARKISQPGNPNHRMLLVFEDITDRKQRERDAQMLTNEISHRIKNNLQVVVGLFAYEARMMPQPWAQGYKAMQARIAAIAQLYDLISQSSLSRTIALDAYLKEIAKTLSASLLGNTSGIQIEVKAAPLEIDSDRAVPFGLLVNELATNAIKHAFPHGTGCVVLSIEQVADQIELTVSDDGIGMKNKGVANPSEKRGADYVAIFVRQLGGTLIVSGSEGTGTSIKIRFPLPFIPEDGAAPLAA